MIYPSHSDWELLIAPEPEPEKPCRKGFLHLNFDELQRKEAKMPLHLQKRIVETSRRYAEVREQRKLRRAALEKAGKLKPKQKVLRRRVTKPIVSRDGQSRQPAACERSSQMSKTSSTLESINERLEVIKENSLQAVQIPAQSTPKTKNNKYQAERFVEFLDEVENTLMNMSEQLHSALPQDEFQLIDESIIELVSELSSQRSAFESDFIDANFLDSSNGQVAETLNRKHEIAEEILNYFTELHMAVLKNNSNLGLFIAKTSDQTIRDFCIAGARIAMRHLIILNEILRLKEHEDKSSPEIVNALLHSQNKFQELRMDIINFIKNVQSYPDQKTNEFWKMKTMIIDTLDPYQKIGDKLHDLKMELFSLRDAKPSCPSGSISASIRQAGEAIADRIEQLQCSVNTVNNSIMETESDIAGQDGVDGSLNRKLQIYEKILDYFAEMQAIELRNNSNFRLLSEQTSDEIDNHFFTEGAQNAINFWAVLDECLNLRQYEDKSTIEFANAILYCLPEVSILRRDTGAFVARVVSYRGTKTREFMKMEMMMKDTWKRHMEIFHELSDLATELRNIFNPPSGSTSASIRQKFVVNNGIMQNQLNQTFDINEPVEEEYGDGLDDMTLEELIDDAKGYLLSMKKQHQGFEQDLRELRQLSKIHATPMLETMEAPQIRRIKKFGFLNGRLVDAVNFQNMEEIKKAKRSIKRFLEHDSDAYQEFYKVLSEALRYYRMIPPHDDEFSEIGQDISDVLQNADFIYAEVPDSSFATKGVNKIIRELRKHRWYYNDILDVQKESTPFESIVSWTTEKIQLCDSIVSKIRKAYTSNDAYAVESAFSEAENLISELIVDRKALEVEWGKLLDGK
jgi:hypothetical protein